MKNKNMSEKKYRYYKRDGTPYKGEDALLQWGKDIEDPDKKVVKQTDLGNGLWVSTVWLGLDHSFLPDGPPQIFETMVFPSKENLIDLDMSRYSTEHGARIGHGKMVKKWSGIKGFLRLIKYYLSEFWWELKWKLKDYWETEWKINHDQK